jgi:FKBP-type peptidyl-prolyl cis-trans isomerase FkpA
MTATRLLAALCLAVGLPATSLANADFLANAAKERGAVRTESGLVYLGLTEGKGAQPKASDVVSVHYRGTFTDGREFDSSLASGKPAKFPLNRVIKCWTEGVQRMKVGGKAKLTCPAALAYGERGAGGGAIPPNATLVFEVELLGIDSK